VQVASLRRSVALSIPARETFTIRLSKIAEAGIMEVVRSLQVVALVFPAIVDAGLVAIVVTLIHCTFTVRENVLAVVVTIGRKWIVSVWPSPPTAKTKRTISAVRIALYNH